MKKLGLFAFVVVFLLLLAGRAHAERVVVVEEPEMQRFATRLRSELVSVGFDVVVHARDEATTLEELARREGAVAALHVKPSRSGIEVWIMDRITSKTVLRELVPSSGDDVGEVAVAAVELLRASLLEVETPKFKSKIEEPTPVATKLVAETKREPAPREPRLGIALGPAIAVSPGGLGVTPHVDVWGRFDAHERIAVGVRIVAPTVPAVVEGSEGRATVTLALAALAVDANLTRPASALRLRSGIGVGAVWAHMEGTAAPSFAGRGDDVVATFSFVHGGAALRIAREARLFADVALGIAAPRPVVSFAGRSAAAWGEPVVLGTVGLELPISF